jgi:trehalose 6-phosphate synthase
MRGKGGLWFGWGGARVDEECTHVEVTVHDGITYAAIPLSASVCDPCHNGFANGTLWPLLHTFLEGFRYRAAEEEAYEAVNEIFARRLQPLLRAGDVLWVHDYPLIPFARKLRALDVSAPIGFFLHVPFPHFETLRALPTFADLLKSLLAYDVIGFQTDVDWQLFLGAVEIMWGSDCIRSDGTIVFEGRRIVTDVYPISVDIEAIAHEAKSGMESEPVRRMNEGLLDRQLIIGVDRPDYSKGILERFEAYQHFLADFSQHVGEVTYLQITPLSQLNAPAHARIRDALEQSAAHTNGRYANADWTPIRYLNRDFPHDILMGLLRSADVCLVTPLRDGMNLVAKEFVAAQDAADPGVLILSDRAGAACELTDALLVNPYDTQEIGRAIQAAVTMPVAERRARHARLLRKLQHNDVHTWQSRFVHALSGVNALTPVPRQAKS